jgi:DNA-binding CsgD family transcriptional regulator
MPVEDAVTGQGPSAGRGSSASAVLGREGELVTVHRFIADERPEPSALLIDGAAGIGKTTLFDQTVGEARELGLAGMVARPGRAETDLSYSALIELLGRIEDDVIEALPTPQTQALNRLLRREEGRFDRLSLSVATLTVVRAIATGRPLLLAIDDVQWLDAPSNKVLSYVTRRLGGAQVRILLARRTEDTIAWPFDLDRSMPSDRLSAIRVGPLGPSDLGRILRRRLGWAPAWPRVLRIAELSGGNPFYALEVARARGSLHATDTLGEPVPEGVTELVRSRLDALPARVRAIVQAASVLHAPTVRTLRAMVPRSVNAERALEEAERAAVLLREGERIRFAHPILSAAAYGSIARGRKAELHAVAAELTEDPVERAHHLAAAAQGPDADVARALEDAAEQAWWRGAPDTAADLMRQACRLTPQHDLEEFTFRRIALGRLLHAAGNAPGGTAELESVVSDLEPGPLRARALFHLMYVARTSGVIERAIEHGTQAVADAEDAPELQAEIYELLSRIADNDAELKLDAASHGLAALARMPDPDPEVAFYGRAALLEAQFAAGLGIRLEALEPIPAEPRRRFPPVRSAIMADDLIGRMLLFEGRIDDGLVTLQRFYERVAVENRSVLPAVLGWIIEGEVMSGRLDAALAHGEELLERIAETGAEGPWAVGFHALALAMAGRLDDAESHAEAVLALAESDPSIGADRSPALVAIGVCAMARGRFDVAVASLGTVVDLQREAGVRDPRWNAHARSELVEALIGAGRLEDAARELALLESDAERASAASSIATAARGRALLEAANGRLETALDAAERSVGGFDALPMPFERARSLFALGQIRRRRKEKRLARESLEEALQAFESVGAAGWADRTRAELARIPVRRASASLTPTEERIAAFAAAGLTNRQIAERSFVSPKTVEANLARVYRKLGIRTRAELGRAMAREGPAVET